jgi:hypothetical protein
MHAETRSCEVRFRQSRSVFLSSALQFFDGRGFFAGVRRATEISLVDIGLLARTARGALVSRSSSCMPLATIAALQSEKAAKEAR